MAIFYIKTKSNDVFELTATTDVSFVYRSSLTRFPVESGVNITDHVTDENTTVSLQGVITEVVLLNKSSPTKGIKDYIEGLERLRKSRELFTVYLDNRLKAFSNCLFTDLTFNKGVVDGLGSWRVSLNIEQVKIADKAGASLVEVANTTSSVDAEKAKAAEKDKLSGKKDEGSKPSEERSFAVTAKEDGLDPLLKKFGVSLDTGGAAEITKTTSQ